MNWKKWNQTNPPKIIPWLFALLVTQALILSACDRVRDTRTPRTTTMIGGEAERGWQALQDYGCIACHTIPGVPRADATVGPPLNNWANRGYIAGRLANTPENLILFIQYPQNVHPGTAMPDMGVTEADARNMAAYLYTLSR